MTTDLEGLLSTRLHREAAELVPDGPIPALPAAAPSRRPAARPASRWWAPVLAAAVVLTVAGTAAIVVRSHRDPGAISAPAGQSVSPVHDSPAAPFSCSADGTLTIHAAQAGEFQIGLTDTEFCLTTAYGAVASSLRSSGPMRSWLSTARVAAGVVDGTVDRMVWIATSGDGVGVTVDLYALGSLRGFAIPLTSGGTIILYSDGTEVYRDQIPYPDEDAQPSPSAPASLPAAQTSYPAGEGPTAPAGLWPTNARGQTYGTATEVNGQTFEPDLIAAYATNGKLGYVLRTDAEGPMPTSISEALAQNNAPTRTIPVYESDGVTQIGVFEIGPGTVTVETPGAGISSSAAPTR